MSTIQLHPDLGRPQTKEFDGEECINAAGVAEVARRCGTAKGRAFYRAYVDAWRRTEGSSLTKGQREQHCIRAGAKAALLA